jgi:hypothetical protein
MANDIGKLVAALQKADEAGDTESAQAISAAIRQQLLTVQKEKPALPSLAILGNPREYRPDSPEFQAKYGPISGMSGVNKFRAGYGKSAVDLARGTGQLIGAVSREDIQRSRELDAPLMATGAGKAGYVTGAIANTVPAAFAPGANTLGGAAVLGTGLGLLQPSASTGETLGNLAFGGAGGPAGLLSGRGLAATYRGGKALLEPFTRGGQERIAARTLEAFAGGRERALEAANEISKRRRLLPGVNPTTAELANNPGIAQLERTLRNNPEFMPDITFQKQSNLDAILRELDEIAGDPARMQWTEAARQAVTSDLYRMAGKIRVRPDKALNDLLDRPSMSKAWARASELAKERGETLKIGVDVPERSAPSSILDASGRPAFTVTEPAQHAMYSGKALHYLKMAMDDMLDNPKASGIGSHEANAIKSTRGELLGWIENKIPEYRLAREWYVKMSRPINQMEVGQALKNKFQPALADFGATGRARSEAFAKALREGNITVARVLGRPGTMEDVMNPLQRERFQLIAEQLARRANADDLGRAVGSNTGQNIVSQNVLRQFLGPLGLPESTIARAAESTLLQSVLRPAQWVGQLGEERAMQSLARAIQNPVVAEEMLRVGIDPAKVGLLIKNQQFLPPLLVSGANAARE